MSNQHKGKIYYSMQAISILPILLYGIIILLFSTYAFSKALNSEVSANLDTCAHLCISLIDTAYPGDYTLEESMVNGKTAYSLYKGGVDITTQYNLLDSIKESTQMDVTLFYQDTRILTTLFDWEEKRIVGTSAPEAIIEEVLKNNQVHFYNNAIINGMEYFAYYHPLTNSDGTVVGMLFVGKPTETIEKMINSSIYPIMIVGLISLVIASIISFSYAKGFLSALTKLKSFFKKVSMGNLNATMDSSILKRNDELEEIAKAALSMQTSLKDMVELDSLTGLFNRRSGEKNLRSTYLTAKDSGTPFSIVIADIDDFKTINDTYGHHNGDIVLQNVSRLLKKHTDKKGYAIRWGGEEFLLVFEKLTQKELLPYLEQLQAELREMPNSLDEKQIYVTMTFGVASDASLETQELIELADERLYKGKVNGKNCIVY